MILHLTPKAAWQTAQLVGEYRTGSLDAQGFIHCSTADQILSVANRFYQGAPELVLLWIDPSRVRAEVRWEAPVEPGSDLEAPQENMPEENASLFPHIYGPLNLDAVMEVFDFPPDADGVFRQVPGLT